MLGPVSNLFARFSTMVVRVFDRGRWPPATVRVDNIRKLACGCMNGSAAFMPLLHPSSLGLRGMFYLVFAVFSSSLAVFCCLHMSDIVINSAYTLASGIILFLLAATSSKTSLDQFTPYIPFSIAIILSATVHVIPKILTTVDQFLYRRAEQAVRLPDSSRAPAGSGSSYSMRSFTSESIFGRYFDDEPFSALALSHMDRQWPQNSRQPSSMSDVSEIDLELGAVQETEASARGEETDLLL